MSVLLNVSDVFGFTGRVFSRDDLEFVGSFGVKVSDFNSDVFVVDFENSDVVGVGSSVSVVVDDVNVRVDKKFFDGVGAWGDDCVVLGDGSDDVFYLFRYFKDFSPVVKYSVFDGYSHFDDDNAGVGLLFESGVYAGGVSVVVGCVGDEADRVDIFVLNIDPVVKESLFFLVAGRGLDSGFGDYSEPVWSEPLIVDKKVVCFNNYVEACKAVEELNNIFSDKFYSVGRHEQYDGFFPLEFNIVSVPVMDCLKNDNFCKADDVVEKLSKFI